MSFRRLLGLLLLLGACSVKEDRSRCPCALELTLTGAPAQLRISGDDFQQEWDCPQDTLLQVPVPRRPLLLSALRGAERQGDGSVRIPPGYDSPPVWVDALRLEPEGETAAARLCPRKSYCALTVVCDGPPGGGEPYWVELRGGVDGWNADGTLSEGPFSCRFVPDAEGRFTVRLPRQQDDSLLMDILFADRRMRTFALGVALSRDGYDWTRPDLEDRTLTLRLTLTDIALASDLWSDEVLMDIEI